MESTMTEVGEKGRVCVTGAGGYVASWLVKLLLFNGYTVHGTLRDPCDPRNAHLKKLDYASENLQLFKADLLDYEGLCVAISGCAGVFHVASPVAPDTVPNPEVELIEPAVAGTRNVLNACLEAKVKKLVVVSSLSAVCFNPKWPKDQAMDEECWSDLEYCKAYKRWYGLAKTLAEMEAREYVEKSKLNIVTFCPAFVIGPMLQSTMNATSSFFLKFLKDTSGSVDFGSRPLVDVRDVAEALMLVHENPKAEGRYICSSHSITTQDLVDKLKSMYPDHYMSPTSLRKEETDIKVSSEKLKKLGWKSRPLEETIADAVKNYGERGAFGGAGDWSQTTEDRI